MEVSVHFEVLSDLEYAEKYQSSNEKSQNEIHIHNTAFLTSSNPTQILSQLSLVNKSLVTLFFQHSISSDKNSVVAMLCLDPTQADRNNTKTNNAKNDNKLSTVQISSTLAASLGCAWTLNSSPTLLQGFLSRYVAVYSEPALSWQQMAQPPPAKHITLHCLGRPIKLTTTSAMVWPRPSNGLAIQRSSILKVQDPVSRCDCYYEVLDLQPKETAWILNDESLSADHGHECYTITPSTDFTYVANTEKTMSSYCRRLPPTSPFPENTTIEYPHPDLPDLLQTLRGISTVSTPHERVVPLVGTDKDHNVRRLVQFAASKMGLRCIAVKGLAAFAASEGHAVTTGSLPDQLAGLQLALQQGKACAPCILHLVDIDLELLAQRNDPPMRHEQEHRIWSLLMAALDPTIYEDDDDSLSGSVATNPQSTRQQKFQSNSIESPIDPRYTPSLLVVTSTTRPLSKAAPSGPLGQNIVYNFLSLSLPDAAYSKYIWEECNLTKTYTTAPKLEAETIVDLITGRSIHDICILHELWCQQSFPQETLNFSSLRDAFANLCKDLDKERRSEAPAKSLFKIANVQWEDVGGLAQVRQEIMDLIELPLKYPQYFPHGGRSGILLYGPPGTGKTLVAKAVATECSIPFLSVKGPELLGSYVGESEANVRGVFANAREAAMAVGDSRDVSSDTDRENHGNPKACLVFFDELDSLAPRRDDTASGSGGGVMDRVVATLAAELDKGMQQSPETAVESQKDSGNCYIFVLGATNRPDLLDPALLRPGRFDRMVYLGVASTPEDRAKILSAQIRHLKFERDMTPSEMATAIVEYLPDNLTGADLSAIGSGALALATQRLCAEADGELSERLASSQKDSSDIDDETELAMIDEILSSWDENRLVPIVTVQDMKEASQEIIPSVSQADLERYERLQKQFSSS